MIIVSTPPNFRPWPEDMPDGYGYVGTSSGIEMYDQTVSYWRDLPPEITSVMNKPLSAPRPDGSSGKPFIIVGPQTIIDEITNLLVKSPLGGLYRFEKGIYSLRGDIVPHELGHMVDFEYRKRAGLSNTTLGSDSVLTNLFSIIIPSLPDGTYAKTNTLELFAEFFSGWVRQDRRFQAIATEPSNGQDGRDYFGASITAVRNRFAQLLPFDGMDLWEPYNASPYPGVGFIPRGSSFLLHVDPQANPTPSSIRWTRSVNGGVFTDVTGMTGANNTVVFPSDTAVGQVTYIAYATNSVRESNIAVFNFLAAAAMGPSMYINLPGVKTGLAGTSVTIYCAAGGNPTPTVQWQIFDPNAPSYILPYTNLNGETGQSLTTTVNAGGSTFYRAVFTNTYGTVYSALCEIREPTTILSAITNFVPGIVTESSIPVRWTAKYGATSYSVEYKVSSDSAWTVFAAATTAITATITGLISLRSYDIKVTPNNALGAGASNTLTIFTAGPASGTRIVDASGVSSAAAYGLRRLRSVYSGPAVRLKRPSDLVEMDIGFIGDDFDSATFETFITGNDPEGEQPWVIMWYDQSSNGVHLAPTFEYLAPTMINDNGQPTLYFNRTAFLTRASFGLYSAGATTMAIVSKAIDFGGIYLTNYVINESSSTTTNPARTYQMMSNVTTDWQVRALNNTPASMWSQSLGQVNDGVRHASTYTDSGTRIKTWIDGTSNHNLAVTRSGTMTVNNFNVGALYNSSSSNYFLGSISELILWKSVLTDTQRQSVESDQRSRFGTA